ncbi:MAG: hypothetical protein OXG15_06245 [Gammaproteobacteria bacterium]|nr:hypothetical protein [Gammaproteobacteria bacterium]
MSVCGTSSERLTTHIWDDYQTDSPFRSPTCSLSRGMQMNEGFTDIVAATDLAA